MVIPWEEDIEGEISVEVARDGSLVAIYSAPAGAPEMADRTHDSAIIPALCRQIAALAAEVEDMERQRDDLEAEKEDLELAVKESSKRVAAVDDLLAWIHENHGGFSTINPRICPHDDCRSFHQSLQGGWMP